jgi:hypothetical protein
MPFSPEQYREWERNHPNRYHRNRHFRPSREARFVGVDGEGWGKTYALLADSESPPISAVDGLSTEECFQFLSRLKERCGNAVFAGFALNYDVNHWLKDVNNPSLCALVRKGQVRWEDWWMQWAPARWFHIKHLPTGNSVRIWDSFPFFQASFLKACDDWGEPVPPEVKLGKEARHSFGPSDLPKIARYNALELKSLIGLLGRLKEGLYSAGIELNQWYGAGAIATRLFATHGARNVIAPVPAEVRAAAMSAMFGGRIETGTTGRIAGPIVNYDVRSAYADALRRLANLAKGRWERSLEIRLSWDGPRELALYHLEWSCPPDWKYCPFPWRDKHGAIYFPPQGRGWYWAPEVRAALLTEGVNLKFLDGWKFVPESDESAFPWIEELYDHRRKVGTKTGAGRAIKLGLSALYGKTAQRDGVIGRTPRYRQYEYAGAITSFVRARLWLKALGNLDRVISFATDGVYATGSLEPDGFRPGNHGEHLGHWEVTEYAAMDSVMPGVYRLIHGDGTWETYARGYGKAGIPWDAVTDGWKTGLDSLTLQLPRFVSLGECIHRGKRGVWIDREKWLTWPDQPKVIRLKNASLKRVGDLPYDPQFGVPIESTPYSPRSRLDEELDLRTAEADEA